MVGRRAGGADVGEEHFGVLYSDVMDHVFSTVTVKNVYPLAGLLVNGAGRSPISVVLRMMGCWLPA